MHHNPNKLTNKTSMRPVFKAVLDPEEYKKYTHFVYIKHLKQQLPGTQVLYLMHKNGIACATNALCINDWLVLHELPPRAAMSEYWCNLKININGTTKIDNRSEKWMGQKDLDMIDQAEGRGGNRMLNPIVDSERAWELYSQGWNCIKIAKHYGVTPAAIYYHIKKMEKRLTKQGL